MSSSSDWPAQQQPIKRNVSQASEQNCSRFKAVQNQHIVSAGNSCCAHVNRLTGTSRKSDFLFKPVNSWPPSNFPTSRTFTFFGVKSCLVLSTFSFHTFRFMCFDARLSLWTFPPSENWNNPISFRNCDAWMWAPAPRLTLSLGWELPPRWTVHVLSLHFQSVGAGCLQKRGGRAHVNRSSTEEQTRQVMC